MERKEGKGCSPPPSTPTACGGSDFHGKVKGSSSSSSSSSGLFNSVFPRPLSTERNGSSHSDIFGPPRKQGCADQAWINGRRTNEGNTSKGNKETTAAYQGERSDPCSLSDSLLYGGQDIYAGPPNSNSSGTSYNYAKDGQDYSDNGSDLASRGNWWQGSLYY